MFSSQLRLALALLVLASVGLAQRTPTQRVQNDPNWFNQGGFGKTVIGIEDFDGDGFADYAVAAPNWPQGGFLGRVYIYSGRTATVLQTFDGSQASAGFGQAMADVGDVDNDGVRDLAISSLNYDVPGGGANQGRIEVYSGATGLSLWQLDGGPSSANLGKHLGSTGGAGPRTIIATQPGWSVSGATGNGRVLFIDAASGAINDWAPGQIVFGGLGQNLAVQPDVGGIYASDGNGDVYSISPGSGGGTATATLLYPAPGSAVTPGLATLAGPTPGSARVAVARQNESSNGLTNNGYVEIFDAGSTTPALTLHGPFNSGFFGQVLARARDVDGDGIEELIILSSGPTFAAPNEIFVYSQTGVLVDQAARGGADSSSLSSIPDVTGDGRGEWLNGIGTGSTTLFECTMFSKGLDIAAENTAGAGTTWTWALDAGPLHPGASYIQGYSLSGAHPGTVTPAPWPLIPLNFDAITDLVPMIAGSPIVPDPLGNLNGSGMANTTLFLPAGTIAVLQQQNAEITTCFVALNGSAVAFASNPITLEF